MQLGAVKYTLGYFVKAKTDEFSKNLCKFSLRKADLKEGIYLY